VKFDLTKPCADCPFRKRDGVRLTHGRIAGIVSAIAPPDGQGGTFACHKTTGADRTTPIPDRDHQHCAGALIFAGKLGLYSQNARIAGRLGMIKFDALNAHAVEVFDNIAQMYRTAISSTRKAKRLPSDGGSWG
jgi:hypothetical protein